MITFSSISHSKIIAAMALRPDPAEGGKDLLSVVWKLVGLLVAIHVVALLYWLFAVAFSSNKKAKKVAVD